MRALVIHPRMTILGGGELLCMHVCKALQDRGYKVVLACDVFDPQRMEDVFGFGDVMAKCEHFHIPPFKHHIIKRFLVLQRLPYARKTRKLLKTLENIDVVFSTQSSLFSFPGIKTYHYLYEVADLYAYGGPGTIPGVASFKGTLMGTGWYWQSYYWFARQIRKLMLGKNPPVTRFYCISHKVLADMKRLGYENSTLLYPPCAMRYHPTTKVPRVVQQVRIVPTKNLEMFIEIARRLPMTSFFLVGRGSEAYPGYKEKLLRDLPENLVYVECSLKDRPDLLEEAKVYLYTAYEHGITISILEALGAGCIPVVPVDSGGAGIVEETIGYTFTTVDEGVNAVKTALETSIQPESIRKLASRYDASVFETYVKSLVP